MEFSEIELNALAKVLTFVRFNSQDYDARYLAGSPIVAQLHKNVTEAMSEFHAKRSIQVPKGWPYIESLDHYLATIKIHIINTDDWRSFGQEQKKEFVNTLIYPYKVLEETITELISYGDNHHKQQASPQNP